MHRILSSIKAATGRQLKQSMKVFQSLMLYRLLPSLSIKSYTNRKSHKFYWWMNISGCPWEEKSFVGILSYKREGDKWFRVNIFLYLRNHPKINSCFQVETCRGRTISISRGTGRECRLLLCGDVPHILSGASSSRRMGCCMKIYLLFMHNAFIYPSKRLTCLGTLAVRTESSLSMTLSTLISSFLSIVGGLFIFEYDLICN